MMDFSTDYFLGQSVQSLTPDPSPSARKLLKDLEICLEGTFQRIAMGMAFGQLANLVPFGRKFKAACKDVHLFVGERMRRAARNLEKDTGRVVMINELVRDAGDENLILSSATTFYSAGTDTSSITIATVLFLLSRHPAVLAKVRAEILDTVEGTPDIESLMKMHYLRAVINESESHWALEECKTC